MKINSITSLTAMSAALVGVVALIGINESIASLSLSIAILIMPVAVGDAAPRRQLQIPLMLAPAKSERIPMAA